MGLTMLVILVKRVCDPFWPLTTPKCLQHISVYVGTYTHTYTDRHTHTQIHTHTHIHAHTYTLTYIHIHTEI